MTIKEPGLQSRCVRVRARGNTISLKGLHVFGKCCYC